MFKILNAEPENYSTEALGVLNEFAHVDNIAMFRAELIENLGTYDALIVRLGHKIDQEILDHAPHLKVVVTATTGLNHIDVVALEKRGVEILCLRGERAFLNSITATAEHCFGLLLSLIRHLPRAHRDVLNGIWDRDSLKGIELAGRTIGIVGYGRLGAIVAGYARAFRMEVLAYDIVPPPIVEGVEFVSMADLVARADVVSVHASYSEGTHHLINADFLQSMKDGAVLINTARGEIVEENALLFALESGKIGGAALDVLQGENTGNAEWMEHDPLVAYARTHENLILTPHIGGATYDSMTKTELFMAEKLKSWHEQMEKET